MSDVDLNADLVAEAGAALASAEPVDVGGAPAAPALAVDPVKEAAENRAFLSGMLGLTFNEALAPRLGDHWKLADQERSDLADAYATLLEKYFPNFRSGPELAAIVVTFVVFGPRIAETAKLKRQKPSAPQAAPADVDAASS